MTNGGALAAGIILLAIAFIAYIFPLSDEGYTIPQVNDICKSGIGQLGQFFSPNTVENCRIVNNLMLGIYGFGLIGIILIIVGAVVPSKKSRIEEKPLTCPYCNYVATSESELLKHKADNHLDKSPFKCEHCDFIGITEEVLWNHYNDKHPGKKKW